jgi:hypothetical protein
LGAEQGAVPKSGWSPDEKLQRCAAPKAPEPCGHQAVQKLILLPVNAGLKSNAE